MKMNRSVLLGLVVFVVSQTKTIAQTSEPVSLQKAIDSALEHNHLLNAKKWQVEEKKAKVEEDRIRKFPVVNVTSAYQYNVNLGSLAIPQGAMGSVVSNSSTVWLPERDLKFDLGSRNTANAGVAVYQPITQLGKIKAGIDIAKTDVQISEQEKEKAVLQVKQAVEKLFYGLLIVSKQQEEANAKLELAQTRLFDLEAALTAGKTIDVNKIGLQASIADEEQNLLKLQIQEEDYTADLKLLTGIKADKLIAEQVGPVQVDALPAEAYKSKALSQNPDIRIAALGEQKTELAIEAARLSYRPDLGLVAGYTYQVGNILFPAHNPFAGISFKWNLQEIYLNRQVINQRNALREQAKQNLDGVREQIDMEIEKAYRKISQATALIAVAQKAANFRTQELAVQKDRLEAGLGTAADLLATRALLARSEADLLAAQLNYRLAKSELELLSGGYL
jgi:outer membrane protein